MQKITAPYGFVPLSQDIVFPDWLKVIDGKAPPLHDVPFQEGICGTMQVEIEAETPIFTRGTKQPDLPFQLHDGRYAIPGTALRGALRNLVEIITFGRFSRVNDDHRYAVRDLHNRRIYGDHMAAIGRNLKTGQQEPMPLVNAGWLRRPEDGTHEIEVCDFGKVEYRELERIAGSLGLRNFRPGEKQSSVSKYKSWGSASLDVQVNFERRRSDRVNNRSMRSEYGVATGGGTIQGRLVFTGQPSVWRPDAVGNRPGSGKAKHHDFVFMARDDESRIEVPHKAFRDFEFAHSDRGQQNRLGQSHEPNEEWAFWKAALNAGRPVPVFFLTEQDDPSKLRALGLAMMFRLGYLYSVGESISNYNPDHRQEQAPLDFSEGLFGTVRVKDRGDLDDGGQATTTDRDRSSLALKGRVGISHALAQGAPVPEREVRVVLGSPKASYYPNYVHQAGAEYTTFMDRAGRPRGWKRYRTLTETWAPPSPTGSGGKTLDMTNVATCFRPLPAGTRFVAHVDVHNLLPQEVGALIWALSFGGDERARHTLGMARPLGYGRCRISVARHDLIDMEGKEADLEACRARFEAYMNDKKPDWRQSAEITELIALARPVPPAEARYQRLDPGNRVNEFVDAKKDYLCLPNANGSGGSLQRQPSRGPSQPSGASGRPGHHQGHQPGQQRGFGSGPPPRREPSAPERPPAAPGQTGEFWTGKPKGARVQVRINKLNKAGQWRCSTVGYPGTSGCVEGTPPGNAEPKQIHTVEVVQGNDATNLVFRWPGK